MYRLVDAKQIDLVIELALDILRRNPGIDPVDIVGHADIAPDHRLDPGPKFSWRRLYEHRVGAWYDDDTANRYRERFDAEPPALANVVGEERATDGLKRRTLDAISAGELSNDYLLRAPHSVAT